MTPIHSGPLGELGPSDEEVEAYISSRAGGAAGFAGPTSAQYHQAEQVMKDALHPSYGPIIEHWIGLMRGRVVLLALAIHEARLSLERQRRLYLELLYQTEEED